jgi:hypothetical protein
VTKADDALAYATTEIGKPYSYGAEGPSAFDCSGLVQWVFAHVGIRLPRTAAAQQDATTAVASPRPGDLVFYGNPAHHVAIYVGGGKQIAAPHSGTKVRMEDVYSGVSNYGRISGLGLGASIASGFTAANASIFSDGGFASGIVDGAREVAVKFGFILIGAGLVGLGAYRTFSPALKRTAKEIL